MSVSKRSCTTPPSAPPCPHLRAALRLRRSLCRRCWPPRLAAVRRRSASRAACTSRSSAMSTRPAYSSRSTTTSDDARRSESRPHGTTIQPPRTRLERTAHRAQQQHQLRHQWHPRRRESCDRRFHVTKPNECWHPQQRARHVHPRQRRQHRQRCTSALGSPRSHRRHRRRHSSR